MDENRVKFYFAYNSPYAFLANTRIERMLAPLGTTIEYKPVYQPRTGGAGPDLSSPRMRYIREDIARFATAYGIAFNVGPFADTGRACRGFLFAREAGNGKPYHDRIFEARWLEGKDIGQEQTLVEIADRCELDRNAYLDAIEQESPYEQELQRSNAEAEADGVFGFPFFVYRGQKFWGNDRIEWLVEEIQKHR
ncbi:MAG: 2-hydroxychromene-2-carboxylate isomerase [Alphaproteobacteria bacterium]